MKKQLLSVLLALCMVLALLPGTAWAENTSGTLKSGVTWSYSDGTLTFQGTGSMDGFSTRSSPWNSYREKIHTVNIGTGVTSIGEEAFDGCSSLTSVTIPNSVTSIGSTVFVNCYNLTSVTLPNSVTTIESDAFGGATGLVSINAASGNPAFSSVNGVLFSADQTVLHAYPAGRGGSYSIPAFVTTIGDYAFYTCEGMISVTIPNSVTTIGKGAFYACSVDSVNIPDSVTAIGEFAFYGCKWLSSITIPDSVTTIEAGTFSDSGLTSMTIPNGVTTIGTAAFVNCNYLTSITIPVSVTTIERAFLFCFNLTDVYYGGSENQWNQISIDNDRNFNDSLLNASIHYNSGASDMPKDEPKDDPTDPKDDPEETPWNKYKIYREGGYEGFDVSLEECMSKTASTTYNPQLAHMLMALSNAAYTDSHISQSLSSLEFSKNLRASLQFITYNIGTKQLDDGTTLALVVVRGSGSVSDWISNFDIRRNASDYHTGFSDAADEIYKSLTKQLGGENFSNVTFVITGHSRGAAAANLLEVKLGQKGVSQKNVYGYNFACPDVAVGYGSGWNPSGKYDNIFNIAHAADPVSLIPGVLGDNPLLGSLNLLKSWGKFGQSRWFAKNWLDALEVGEANIWNAANHDPQKYLESLRDELSFNTFKTWPERIAAITVAQTGPGMVAGALSKLFSFQCPVDVVITNAGGTPVASVIGGEANYYDSAFGEVMIFTSGDEKMILIQGGEPLTVQLTGTDEGTMDYTVQTVNLDSGEALYETVFLDVPLTDGKQMQSSVDDDVEAPKVSLYVLDGSGNPTEEIQPDREGPMEASRKNPFTDVFESEYYYDAVLWAVANDITQGTSSTTFSPDKICTHAQILTFLWRAAGEPAAGVSAPVTVLSSYQNAVNWAFEKGMIDSGFDASAECTRADAVNYMWQAAGSPSATANSFDDVPANASYATAVGWAVSSGVTKGTSTTTFSPNQTCTRAQIVTFLYRDHKG